MRWNRSGKHGSNRDALTMAAANIDFAPGVIFHSDRGAIHQRPVRRASGNARPHRLHGQDLGLTASMGKTGVCWDNAMAESFFGALNNELVYRTVFSTRERARTAIAEYIEVFYNRQRLHSALDYRTPAEVADQYSQNIALAA